MTSRLQTTTRRARPAELASVHPGEILLEEFLKPMGISQYRLAKSTGVPARRINEIVHGTRAISADTALRLARYFGTSPNFWMNLQARYDLEVHGQKLGSRLEREVSRLNVALRSCEARAAMEAGICSLKRGDLVPHARVVRGQHERARA